ncbi:MAG: L-2-hydroxyglutarate oxidase [Actinomycetota bacterium]|nr:L-2-hydroxyglutarate oxidase [Actinomycetota bacterium]
MSRYVIIGGGILGLSTAHRLLTERPGSKIVLLEKENRWAAHQTGHNSGVVHAGVYYPPGSMKARLSSAGNGSMVAFARDHGIAVEICGKLIVATAEAELPALRALYDRARHNGLPVAMMSAAQARELEPEVAAVAGVHSPTTGIIDYAEVCRVLAGLLERQGGDLRLGERVLGIRVDSDEVVVMTARGELHADHLVNCAGLHSDRVARMAGLKPRTRIVPFRGEYYELRAERSHLVRGLIYPVPDPSFPFLGVHLTRGVHGSVHAGPNAVLALSREGYDWKTVRVNDLAETLCFPGFWRLARRHYRTGIAEMRRSVSTKQFAASLARLVPAITPDDLLASQAGVRAQALTPAGRLVDDFLVLRRHRQVHVLNAPSPAATAALEIAKHIVASLD